MLNWCDKQQQSIEWLKKDENKTTTECETKKKESCFMVIYENGSKKIRITDDNNKKDRYFSIDHNYMMEFTAKKKFIFHKHFSQFESGF